MGVKGLKTSVSWLEADKWYVASYKATSKELNSGQLRPNPVRSRVKGLNSGPLDYKPILFIMIFWAFDVGQIVQFFITNFKQGKHWAVSVGKWNNCLVAGISNMVINIVEYIAITNFGKGMFRASIKYQIFQICWSCFPPYFMLWLITNQCFQTTFICKIHRHILLFTLIGPWACFHLNQWTK